MIAVVETESDDIAVGDVVQLDPDTPEIGHGLGGRFFTVTAVTTEYVDGALLMPQPPGTELPLVLVQIRVAHDRCARIGPSKWSWSPGDTPEMGPVN